MEEPTAEIKPIATNAIHIKDLRAIAILESLKNGGSILAACKGAGIHPATFWRWRKEDTELNSETEIAIASRVMVVEDALYNECIKGNATLIMFFLMNRAGENWKDRRVAPNISANAIASAEAASGNANAARKRIARNMRILQGLGLSLEPEGAD
jgi:hypothetical protein